MILEQAMTVLLAALVLTGCAGGNVGLRAGDTSSNRGSPPPGTSYSTAAIRAEVSPNAYFGMVFLGSVILGFQDESRRRSDRESSRIAPEMAEGRAIAERDCGKPLEQLEANLRCK